MIVRLTQNQHNNIASLYLWENKIGSEGAEEIAAALSVRSILVNLDVTQHMLLALTLCLNFWHMPQTPQNHVTSLHLATCDIGPKGAKAIAAALSVGHLLTSHDAVHFIPCSESSLNFLCLAFPSLLESAQSCEYSQSRIG